MTIKFDPKAVFTQENLIKSQSIRCKGCVHKRKTYKISIKFYPKAVFTQEKLTKYPSNLIQMMCSLKKIL